MKKGLYWITYVACGFAALVFIFIGMLVVEGIKANEARERRKELRAGLRGRKFHIVNELAINENDSTDLSDMQQHHLFYKLFTDLGTYGAILSPNGEKVRVVLMHPPARSYYPVNGFAFRTESAYLSKYAYPHKQAQWSVIDYMIDEEVLPKLAGIDVRV